jgi:hypothetical protein
MQDMAGTRRVLTRVLALLVLLAVPGVAGAGSEDRKGTSGAPLLEIPIGPRGTALGGGVVGDVTGVESIYWNPAGISSIEGTEAMFSNVQYFADQSINYLGVATKLGDWASLGVNAKVLSIGEIIVTTEAAPDGTGEIVEPTFTVFGLTLGRQFTDRVRAGATVNFVNERIMSMSASGVAFDLGVQYLTGWRGLQFGVVMKNFGTSMTYTGQDAETNQRPADSDPTSSNRTFTPIGASFEMPSYFALSASYNAMATAEQRLSVLGSFQNNNFVGDNVVAGLEWGFRNMFAVRGSWFGSITSRTDLATGEENGDFSSGDDLYEGFAFGAGADLRAGGTRLGLDVSYRPVKEFFDDIVEVGLRLKF